MNPARHYPMIDDLLTHGIQALDLTLPQFADVKQKYEDVGGWLNKPGTLLAPYNPHIYPQGSMALGTAVKPVGRDEFDLDFVCELHNVGYEPAYLKRIIGQRLGAHGTYRARLKEKNRCWRIAYANEFHLDIIPARPDGYASSETALWVPDKELRDWTATDPKGYVEWFFDRCFLGLSGYTSVRGKIEPMPSAPQERGKWPLQLAVQLMKRHRDLSIGNHKDAPISIIITTLAGRAYKGGSSVYETLWHLAQSMPHFIGSDQWGNPTVLNPVNPKENFADKWAAHPRKRERFQAWCQKLVQDLEALEKVELHRALSPLQSLVGERAAKAAIKHCGENMRSDLNRDGMGVSLSTGRIVPASSIAPAVPPNTFYGGTK